MFGARTPAVRQSRVCSELYKKEYRAAAEWEALYGTQWPVYDAAQAPARGPPELVARPFAPPPPGGLRPLPPSVSGWSQATVPRGASPQRPAAFVSPQRVGGGPFDGLSGSLPSMPKTESSQSLGGSDSTASDRGRPTATDSSRLPRVPSGVASPGQSAHRPQSQVHTTRRALGATIGTPGRDNRRFYESFIAKPAYASSYLR